MRATPNELNAVQWRKSSYSNPDGGNCVEISVGVSGDVPVRDSKNISGPVLMVNEIAWRGFVWGVKDGTL